MDDDTKDLLIDIRDELRNLNARLDRVEKDIRNVRLNNTHPLLKLLFK